MRRPQFTIRALPVAMLVVAAFFAGIHFERETPRRQNEADHNFDQVRRPFSGIIEIFDPSAEEQTGK